MELRCTPAEVQKVGGARNSLIKHVILSVIISLLDATTMQFLHIRTDILHIELQSPSLILVGFAYSLLVYINRLRCVVSTVRGVRCADGYFSAQNSTRGALTLT